MGVLCFPLLIDSPSSSGRWLEPEEIRYLELRQIARRVGTTVDHKEKHFDSSALWAVVTDWKVYLLTLGSWSNAVPN